MGDQQNSIASPEDLYGVPLDGFTSARDALAARLKDEGDSAGAKAAKALKKPTLPAWTVNQLARQEGETLHRLMELRDEMADAAGPDEIRRLSTERKRITSALLQGAEAILSEAGHPANANTLDAVAKTLQSGGSDEDRLRLLKGTLDRPLNPSGFEGLGGFDAFATPTSTEEQETTDPAAIRKAEKLAAAASEAEREASDLSNRAEKARRTADELEFEAESARKRAERARKKADQALDAAGE